MQPASIGPNFDLCIIEDVRPLLAELSAGIQVEAIGSNHLGRAEVVQFVRHTFTWRHRADVRSFNPILRSCSDGQRRRAAAGLRGDAGGVFSEKYLYQGVAINNGEQAHSWIIRRTCAVVLCLDEPLYGSKQTRAPPPRRYVLLGSSECKQDH